MHQPEIIIVPALFATIAYISWLLVTSGMRKYQLRVLTEFHTRLVDKLGSVQDVSVFLSTEAGSRFMRDLTTEPARAANPKAQILRAAQRAAVLVCVGIGAILISLSPSLRAIEGLTIVGTLILSVGVGFAISAVVAYRLAGPLGLLDTDTPVSTSTATSRA